MLNVVFVNCGLQQSFIINSDLVFELVSKVIQRIKKKLRQDQEANMKVCAADCMFLLLG